MANTKSAKKRAEKSAAQRIKNRTMRSRMRTAVKKLRAAVATGDEKMAQELLPITLKVVDSTAQKGIIHRDITPGTKSRLVAALRKAQ